MAGFQVLARPTYNETGFTTIFVTGEERIRSVVLFNQRYTYSAPRAGASLNE